jgi:hypothetical protein
MGDKYLHEFGRETLRKTPLGIRDNIKIDLKGTEWGYGDWIVWVRVGTCGGEL